MKTILITGGASGFGRGISLELLKKGYNVIAVGSSKANGDEFLEIARRIKGENKVYFLQADLSLIKENYRVINEIKERFEKLDGIIFTATKHNTSYTETIEGIEATFALDYLSRFIFSNGLEEVLERCEKPLIVNMCGTGYKGEVNWEDMYFRKQYKAMKVMMHGSRLNDLGAVAFKNHNANSNIRYLLYNPSAVQTPSMLNMYKSRAWKLMYKIIAKTIEKASNVLVSLIETLPNEKLMAYTEQKKIDLSMPTYDSGKAERLYEITAEILKQKS